ncbi:uncharacterized protein C3orf62 [Latimeria chalumnae]|uniref:Chromosome 3 open reading frame 62 n=1 Tax=Latimeria chalumnae TaxID=7897 RepID=M3XIC4_LATCH|nr:PREDICTED: uncharacterized protein C3orf62 homolog [Latimeria chalumnae]XP_014341968.1 PREDICTED: uncharacterized protein C3orf62 homolog [Latimeria chalumnae]XP_014341969.1 PREDICTED: uncharacterized protein C3orf62 homolog [Latimeria chalumnae]|eukprot:XP_005992740.2 PREDICTED: uncharacterized protein C3orf62 homolog [Latimeria chalumnae]
MSEKLRQCRQDLAAALDRAFEDIIVRPSCSKSPDNSCDPKKERQRSPSPSLPNVNALIYKRCPPHFSSSYTKQPLLSPCSPSNGSLVFLPRQISADLNNSLYSMRIPFANKENLIIHPCSLSVEDSCSRKTQCDSDVSMKENFRKDTRSYSVLETNNPSSCPSDEITKDLLDIIESTSITTLEDLTGKLEFENELNRACSRSEGSLFQEELLELFLDDTCSGLTEIETKVEKCRSTEDENIIETVLDMEEDYNLLSCHGHFMD